MCTRWPTAARVVFSRLHPAYAPSTFSVYSGLKHEPASGVICRGDGSIIVTDNVMPSIDDDFLVTVVGSYVPGAWTKVETDWDFVAGTLGLSLNSVFIGTFPIRVSKAFWMGIFGHEPTTFYDDDSQSHSISVASGRTAMKRNRSPGPGRLRKDNRVDEDTNDEGRSGLSHSGLRCSCQTVQLYRPSDLNGGAGNRTLVRISIPRNLYARRPIFPR